jgi:hypothetical protein
MFQDIKFTLLKIAMPLLTASMFYDVGGRRIKLK